MRSTTDAPPPKPEERYFWIDGFDAGEVAMYRHTKEDRSDLEMMKS